ncbi:MAG: transaldolase family protein [Candidatus Bipolaricaulia bacterium]
MGVWISGSIEEVEVAAATGLIEAVATNPRLIVQWTDGGRYTLEEVVEKACRKVDLPLFVQLWGPKKDEFLVEAEALRSISTQICFKLPATPDGISAASQLARGGIATLVTAVCSVNQAYLAAVAGAHYIAPYFGRINAAGQDAPGLIRNVAELYMRHGIDTKIVAASVRTPEDATGALLSGAHAVVVFYSVFEELFRHDVTRASLEQFEQDWNQIRYETRGKFHDRENPKTAH